MRQLQIKLYFSPFGNDWVNHQQLFFQVIRKERREKRSQKFTNYSHIL